LNVKESNLSRELLEILLSKEIYTSHFAEEPDLLLDNTNKISNCPLDSISLNLIQPKYDGTFVLFLEGNKSIFSELESSPLIKMSSIDISHCRKAKLADFVLQCAVKSTNINKLSISNSNFSNDSAKNAELFLSANTSIKTLDLSNSNFIGEEHGILKGLSRGLNLNKSLVFLNLASTNIEDEGMKSLSKALKLNSSIQTLFLNSNHLHNEGIKLIAEVLIQNKTLKEIKLDSNYSKHSAFLALFYSLRINMTLKECTVEQAEGLHVKNLLIESFGQSLLYNIGVQRLDISLMIFPVSSLNCLARSINRHPSIKSVTYFSNASRSHRNRFSNLYSAANRGFQFN